MVILTVAPIPPLGISERAVLYTSTPLTLSVAMSPKSNERPPVVGIWRLLRVTKLNSGPKPRTVILLPSPLLRSIDTPVIRCKDSARLVSGNLPMSSEVIASTTPAD